METLKIAQKLSSKGYDVTLVCPIGSTLEKEGLKQQNGLKIFGVESRYLKSITEVSKLLKEKNIDIVHTHLSHDLSVIVPALHISRSKSKLFLTKHIACNIAKRDLIHKLLYRRVDGIFAISSFIMGNVLASCPVPIEKIHIVPNGLDLENFIPDKFNKEIIREKYKIPLKTFVVGLIGRISPKKGHEEFLHAAKILSSKINNISFVIAGSASHGEDEYEKRIKTLAKELKLDNVVKFLGFQKNIPEILSAFDVLAFPSYEESFGNILLESLAMKIPIVASNSAGVLDIITDGETGVLVPPHDPEMLAEGILNLLSNRSFRTTLINTGRSRVENCFSFESMISKLEKHYAR